MKVASVRAVGACFLMLAACSPSAWAQDSQPLTLKRAIQAALAGNPDLQGFEYSFKAQDARTRQAALRPAPEVSVDVENVLGTGETRGTKAAEFTFALSQVLELGDKRGARVDVAKAERSALETERQVRQMDVLAEVTRRFITVAQRQDQVRVARRAVELSQQTVEDSERRVNAAKSPHAELDRARIALDRATLAERAATVDLDTSRKQLAAMWGESQPVIDGAAIGEVTANLFSLPFDSDFETLAKRLADNPDFLKFATEARLRDAQIRLATSLRRPDLTVGGGIRRLQADRDQAFVASLSMPLFSGKRGEAFVAEAEANRELVDVEKRAAMVKAKAMLYELHKQLARAIAEAGTLEADILPRTEEAMNETKYAYERGRYSYIELVDAQREYLEVQSALIDAAVNAHSLQVEIERLTNAPLATR